MAVYEHAVSAGLRSRIGFAGLLAALTALLVVSMTIAVGLGAASIPFGRVWAILVHEVFPSLVTPTWDSTDELIVTQIRLPRVLLGALVGAGLAVTGAALQALVRNPLADPYILGVSSGAAFGAVLVILSGASFVGVYSLTAAAFVFGLLAFMLVYAFSRRAGQVSPTRLILAGVAIAAFFFAATNFLTIAAPNPDALRSAVFWQLGSLAGAVWRDIPIAAAAVMVGLLYLYSQARALNAISVGDETAASLGIDLKRFRWRVIILSSVITGALVAVSGGIGFVALMMPHVVRLFVGSDHRRVIPLAAVLGALFMVWVDVAARLALEPREIPAGVVTAAIGAPFFLWLLRRLDAKAGMGA